MADAQHGSPVGKPAAANSDSPHPNQSRRNKAGPPKARGVPHHLVHADGSVSDSATNMGASPQSVRAPKQRNQSGPKASAQHPRPPSGANVAIPGTPLKEHAYAGATFQASPAPSSLPVPKFFSRSMKGASSPEPDIVLPQPPPKPAQQSPLDMFFQADRVERQRSGSNLSPEMVRRAPATTDRQARPSGKSMLMRELDSDDGDASSPRLVSSQPLSIPSHNNAPQQPRNSDKTNDAYTKSLKDLLFSTANTPPASRRDSPLPQSQTQNHTPAQELRSVFASPSPQPRPGMAPTTPGSVQAPLNNNPQHDQYSLRYGNRNLSPLFKAAAASPGGASPWQSDGERRNHAQLDGGVQVTGESPAGPARHLDPNAFSRAYLDEHVRSSGPQLQRPPQSPLYQQQQPLRQPQQQYSHYHQQQQQQQQQYQQPPNYPQQYQGNQYTQHQQHQQPQQIPQWQHNTQQQPPAPLPHQQHPQQTSSATSPPQDVQTMEDNLRRMLNLNVLRG